MELPAPSNPGYSLVDGMGRLFEGGVPALEPGASMQDRLVQGLLAELPRLQRLPAQVDRLASLAGRGELRTRIVLFSTEQDARVITTLVNRLVLGVGGALLFIGSTLLLVVSEGPGSSINTSLTRTFGYVGLALASTLLLRVVAAIVREGYN
jgi:hypothetical protein